MHARSVRFPVHPDQRDEVVAGLRANTPVLRQHAGFQHAYWLYDAGHQTMLSVALYDTAEHERAAWEQQSSRVMARMQELGVTPEVHTYEVVHEL
jgi:quinol monooxygenase YgiN